MTPVENKAKELYKKYIDTLNIKNDMHPGPNPFAQACATACCYEVIAEIEDLQQNCVMEFPMALAFWNDVKSYIEKL